MPKSASAARRRLFQCLLTAHLCVAAVLPLGCQSCETEDRAQSRQSPKKERTLAPTTRSDTDSSTRLDSDTHPVLPDPTTLITLDQSAYGNQLAVDDTTVYLLTATGVWRFSPDSQPSETKLNLQYNPALTDTDIIYWIDGAFRSVPKKGGPEKILGKVALRPRVIVSDEKSFAWLDLSASGSFTFQVLKKGKPHQLYRTVNKVTTPIMQHQRIYFVEQADSPDTTATGPRWRLGSVSVAAGGETRHGPWQTGRTPSMLGGQTNIYYFDLPSRSVRSVSPDLTENTVVGNKLVCTPFAVSDRILCSRVEGIFQIPKNGTHPAGDAAILADKPMGLTVNIAASNHLVAWLNDIGEDKLALRVLPLAPLSPNGAPQPPSRK